MNAAPGDDADGDQEESADRDAGATAHEEERGHVRAPEGSGKQFAEDLSEVDEASDPSATDATEPGKGFAKGKAGGGDPGKEVPDGDAVP